MDEVLVSANLAKVVHLPPGADQYELVINRGRRHGIKMGDRFLVFGIGPALSDPDTGEDLGHVELVRGRGEVIHVQENLATLRSVETSRTYGKRVTRPYGGMSGFLGPVTEEEIPPAQLPFERVAIGDLARPI